jgi:hypothetical protein
LLCIQAINGAQSLFLALAALAHVITLWEIIALTIFGGLVTALGAPARMSYTPGWASPVVPETNRALKEAPRRTRYNTNSFKIRNLRAPMHRC